jgi:hypothetical protein
MSGAFNLFTCGHCRAVVSAQTLSVGNPGSPPRGEVEPQCPNCGRRDPQPWGDGEPPAGQCPRCSRWVRTESIGIAD